MVHMETFTKRDAIIMYIFLSFPSVPMLRCSSNRIITRRARKQEAMTIVWFHA